MEGWHCRTSTCPGSQAGLLHQSFHDYKSTQNIKQFIENYKFEVFSIFKVSFCESFFKKNENYTINQQCPNQVGRGVFVTCRCRR